LPNKYFNSIKEVELLNRTKVINIPGKQILYHRNFPESDQAASKKSIRKLSIRSSPKSHAYLTDFITGQGLQNTHAGNFQP